MSVDKVLILGDDTRSFLAIVRSLGRQGVTVHVAPQRWGSVALRSRYIQVCHDLPAWSNGEAEWAVAVEALLRAERYDLVIPCDETSLLPMARHRGRLEALTRLAVPDDRSIAVLFDKHETRKLAEQVGVPVAPGRLPAPEDTPGGLIAAFGLPLFVKPRRSFTLEGLRQRQLVSAVTDVEQLADLLPLCDPDQVLIEGCVPGQGLGVSILAHRGRILQIFQHHRVREDRSGSYYRVSAPLDPRYREAVAAMASALDYTGVAMFEFRADGPAGQWALLEVNARPWGSLPLAVNAGVDFPWAWFRLLIAGEELPPMATRIGLYGRNLVPDLRAILNGMARHPWQTLVRLGELGRVLTGQERHDVLTRDDPAPGQRELAKLFGQMARQIIQRLPGGRALTQLMERTVAGRGLRRAGTAAVLFVCQGNICRSPFAAEMMRVMVPNGITIRSAGLLARAQRRTPPVGIEVAAARGINLESHWSQFLTLAMAQEAALIVVFDRINVDWLRTRYPGLTTPVVMLGRITGAGEIDDPVDGDAAVFAESYDRIAAGVRALVALLPR